MSRPLKERHVATEATCTKCKTLKPASEFYSDSRHANGLRSWCKSCLGDKKRVNGDRAHWDSTYQAKKRYGLTRVQFDALMTAATHCPICTEPMEARPASGSRWKVVDHCHTSGKVRRVICNKCNSALGLIADNPATARRMAQYLEDHA